jgi:hypothetical protein
MPRGPTKLLAFVAAASLSGCSLLLLGDDFASEGAAPPSSDVNAETDPGETDARSPTDATEERRDATVDASTPTLCDSQAWTVCDSFERSTPAGDWLAVTSGGGTLSIVPGPSGGRLLATCPGKGARAQLRRAFAPTPTRIRYEVTLEYAANPTAGEVYITGVEMPSAGGTSLTYLYANPNIGIVFVQQRIGSPSYVADELPVNVNTPHRIAVDLTFQGNVRVTVDGITVLDRASESFLVPAPPTILLGASDIDEAGGGFDVLLDDYAFLLE